MRVRIAGLALCAAGLAFAGCGTGADRRAAQSAAESFYAAVHDHDGARACALFSEAPPDCEQEVVKLSLHGSRVASESVYATSAQVRMDGGDTVFLSFSSDGWKVDAVGCHTVPGGGPLQCEEES